MARATLRASMPCSACGSPLAADQRYCLECGARNGPPRLDWRAMVGAEPAPEHHDVLGPGLPSPRIAAALILGVLAFGVVVGNAAGPGASAADAGGRSNVTILAAAPAAVAPAVAPAAQPAVPETTTPEEPATPEPSTPEVDEPSATAEPDASSPAIGTDDTTGDTTDDATDEDDGTTDDADTAAPPRLPPVKHVWVVALTGHSYDETFGAASPAPYLATELRAKGTLLPWYHAAGHDPSAGGVALLGGQKDGVGPFDGKTPTLADQLTGLGRTWKAYVEGATAGLNPGDDPCARPPDQAPRNPFLRFATITGASECGSSLAELDRLAADVADTDSAPAFSYILPGPAHDGSTSLADADAWLKATLPTILDSKAYADGGLVVVTFDTGAPQDAEAGGGRVGALLLSPYVEAGGTVDAPYDPFSLLASIEALFGLDPIGYAADTTLRPFGPKVYAGWNPAEDAGS
ncbi:MAG TPA: alkaline phosphatase family protein [Baekduia sp.]|nr:alkaline phosphatase family protein [Baekduia sp.]